ncbi:MAG: RNA polymerase sigma factor [Planctomycetota bacterium JB042]
MFARDVDAVDRFLERLGCVRRMLAAQNAGYGRPLTDHELEDLEQDVLTVVWRKLDRFDGTCALETWVYRTAHFELLNGLRRKRRQPAAMNELDMLVPDDSFDPREHAEAALRALERLGPPADRIIRMKHFEHLGFEEIADRLGTPTNTVKTRYYRGLERLRVLMRQAGGEGSP